MFFLHGLPAPPGVSVPKDAKKRRFNLMISQGDDSRLATIRSKTAAAGFHPSLAVTVRAGLLLLANASAEELKQAILQIQREDLLKADQSENLNAEVDG